MSFKILTTDRFAAFLAVACAPAALACSGEVGADPSAVGPNGFAATIAASAGTEPIASPLASSPSVVGGPDLASPMAAAPAATALLPEPVVAEPVVAEPVVEEPVVEEPVVEEPVEAARPEMGESACGLGDVPERTDGLEAGDPVPQIEFTDQHGESHYMSDYCGQFVLIEFGSFWCPYCREEATEQDGRNANFENFVAFSLWAQTTRGRTPTVEELAEFASEVDVVDSLIGADDDSMSEFAFVGDSSRTPRMAFVDPEGRLIELDVRSDSQIARLIERYEDENAE